MPVNHVKKYLISVHTHVVFSHFFSELQIAPTIPILEISVRNLVQGLLRTYSWLIRLKFRIPVKAELY